MESVAVVAVPFPEQGHLNAMLHLSLLLASRGLTVHFTAPWQHVRQARARLGLTHPGLHRVPRLRHPRVREPAARPGRAVCVPVPTSWPARAPVAALLSTVSALHRRRVVVLYDRLSSFAAPEAARVGNAEAFCLVCVAAAYDASWTEPGRRLLRERGLDAPPSRLAWSENSWSTCSGRRGIP